MNNAPDADAAAEHAATLAAQATVMAVNEAGVTTVTRDRHLPRKELAKLVRGLLKTLGVKGVSVTTPNYSMASSIDIRLPRRDDCVGPDGYYDEASEGARENNRVRAKFNEILARAFPQHDDRSDAQSDHFDFKFSIQ